MELTEEQIVADYRATIWRLYKELAATTSLTKSIKLANRINSLRISELARRSRNKLNQRGRI